VAGGHAMYRYFDAGQVLLYIGKSGALASREQAHIATSDWMEFAASSTIERFGTPEELADAERAAILSEHPVFNKQHNNTPAAKRRLRAYLKDVGRLDLLQTRQARPVARTPRSATDPWLSQADRARREAL